MGGIMRTYKDWDFLNTKVPYAAGDRSKVKF